MGAPRVVAKGAQLVAARIREIAAEHQVPIVEAPPLARALHRHAELGDEIPEVLYAAVAEVLAYIPVARHRSFGGIFPQAPRHTPVPRKSRSRKRICMSVIAALPAWNDPSKALRGLAGPILIILVMAMMILPLCAVHSRSAIHLQHRAVDHGVAGLAL